MGGNLIKIISSATGEEIEIKHKSCEEAHRTLGVMKIPRGDNQAELQRLKEKADNFTRQIGASNISRIDAKIAHDSIYRASVGYSLASTCFKRPQLEKVQGAPISTLLSKMGYNRNIPRAIVFGPKLMGGLGMLELFVEQGRSKGMKLLEHVRNEKSQLGVGPTDENRV
jgi:hypothetical protein